MKQTNFFITTIIIALLLSFTFTAAPLWAADKKEIKQEKADIRKMSKETLARLYKVQPAAKNAVAKSAGYAVFSNFGTKIFVAGGGSGKGLIVDKKTKKETFMKMIEVQAGIALGSRNSDLCGYSNIIKM